jgi:hypothetical protein
VINIKHTGFQFPKSGFCLKSSHASWCQGWMTKHSSQARGTGNSCPSILGGVHPTSQPTLVISSLPCFFPSVTEEQVELGAGLHCLGRHLEQLDCGHLDLPCRQMPQLCSASCREIDRLQGRPVHRRCSVKEVSILSPLCHLTHSVFSPKDQICLGAEV